MKLINVAMEPRKVIMCDGIELYLSSKASKTQRCDNFFTGLSKVRCFSLITVAEWNWTFLSCIIQLCMYFSLVQEFQATKSF